MPITNELQLFESCRILASTECKHYINDRDGCSLVEPYACVLTHMGICTWFEDKVLPMDAELQAEYEEFDIQTVTPSGDEHLRLHQLFLYCPKCESRFIPAENELCAECSSNEDEVHGIGDVVSPVEPPVVLPVVPPVNKTPMNKDVIQIFVDGACLGNPGPGGWGVVVTSSVATDAPSKGVLLYELSGGNPDTTNNQMELTAAIKGLSSIPEEHGTVTITSDSKYVIEGITKWIGSWESHKWKTSTGADVKNPGLWRQLNKLNQKHKPEWKWVKGHAGHPENERCDELARIAAEEQKKNRKRVKAKVQP